MRRFYAQPLSYIARIIFRDRYYSDAMPRDMRLFHLPMMRCARPQSLLLMRRCVDDTPTYAIA